MPSTNRFLTRRISAAVVGAALVAGGIAWRSAAGSEAAPQPGTRSFWTYLTGSADEVDPPDDVREVSRRADAIVVAHVTGVVDGRDDAACREVAPQGSCSIPRTVFVQLTVDRTVHGSVKTGQVLNLEMFRPPKPLTLEDARKQLPPGGLLFFLAHSSDSSALQPVWGVVGLRGVVSQASQGISTALDPRGENAAFLQSFHATTVDQAANAAAAALG
jgi:hypothetical protein